ncbi:MAG: class I SAM-dependent methyltransferase [Candidatus Paceibacterota bacterium]
MANKNILHTRDVIRHSLQHISGKTLDFGAGNAKYRGLIQPRTTEYTTFDMVAGPNIDIVGDVHKVPLADKSFDTIVSTQVLEHVRMPWVMVAEISRLLRSGGTCILSAPFMQPFHADPHDYFRYTKEGMTSLFESNGFQVIECESYGGLFSTLSEMVHFSLFDPYNKKHHATKQRIFRYVEKFICFFDRFSRPGRIYTNTYIIARKK